MQKSRRIVVLTPWYPSEDRPYYGSFVREWIRAAAEPAGDVLIAHLDEREIGDEVPIEVTETPEGKLLRLSIPLRPDAKRAVAAHAQLAVMERSLMQELAAAEVVIAHVGIPTAWAAARAMPHGTRLVTVEHSSMLKWILVNAELSAMYREVVERSDAFLTAGEAEASRVRLAFVDQAEGVRAVGNPVDAQRFPLRAATPERLNRWLYVGNLIKPKGVGRVIDAYAEWRAHHPERDSSLTIVGEGVDRASFEAQARRLAVADSTTFLGAVSHAGLAQTLANVDVLVHLSWGETFGLTLVEAALTGLPVIATRCGGPELTLAFASAANLASLVPLRAKPSAVRRAVEALEAALPNALPHESRDHLLARFGHVTFGNTIRSIVEASAPDTVPSGAPVVVIAAFTGAGRRECRHLTQAALRAGFAPTLVVDDPREVAATDRRVKALSIRSRRPRWLLHSVRHMVLSTIPEVLLRSIRFLCARLASFPGGLGRFGARGVTFMTSRLGWWRVWVSAVEARSEESRRALPWRGAAGARRAFAMAPGLVEGGVAMVIAGDRVAARFASQLASATGATLLREPSARDFEKAVAESRRA